MFNYGNACLENIPVVLHKKRFHNVLLKVIKFYTFNKSTRNRGGWRDSFWRTGFGEGEPESQ